MWTGAVFRNSEIHTARGPRVFHQPAPVERLFNSSRTDRSRSGPLPWNDNGPGWPRTGHENFG